MAWSFTRDPGTSMFAFLRAEGADLPTDWAAALSVTGGDLVMAPLYIVMAVVIAYYRPLRLPVMLAFGVFVVGLRTFGFVLPDYFATVTFTLVALAAVPPRLPRHVWPLIMVTGLLQFGLGWVMPLGGEPAAWHRAVTSGVPRPVDVEETVVAQAMAERPRHSTLVDDRTAYRIIARTGTAHPFLTPADPLYGLALSQPARFVPSMLARATGSEVPDDPARALAMAQPDARVTQLSTAWWLYEWTQRASAARVGSR